MTPAKIVASKRPGRSVVGWRLDSGQRADLIMKIPPRYRTVVADHVTLAAKVAADTPLPEKTEAQAIGLADDGQGVEALVVAIEGETDRPGGSTYHITWSLAAGRKAAESNDVIAAVGWRTFAEPFPVSLYPARFP